MSRANAGTPIAAVQHGLINTLYRAGGLRARAKPLVPKSVIRRVLPAVLLRGYEDRRKKGADYLQAGGPQFESGTAHFAEKPRQKTPAWAGLSVCLKDAQVWGLPTRPPSCIRASGRPA